MRKLFLMEESESHQTGHVLNAREEEKEMKTFEVWAEGYRATGDREFHRLMGKVEAETFKEACDIVFSKGDKYFRECYNPERLSHWGCRLFDNANDAAEAFG